MLESKRIKPVLKWVGGKSQIFESVVSFFPSSFSRYHEPFLGGGAVFFGLQPKLATLSDTNKWLINFYEHLRQTPENLAELALELGKKFNSKRAEQRQNFYYEIREEFNRTKAANLITAANFLFLNKTAFNGVYRENSKGQFNVPFNQAKSEIGFIQPEEWRQAAACLQNADIYCGGFETVLSNVKPQDLVYFDPPYVPLSETASFTGYSSKGFDENMQIELIDAAKNIRDLGAQVVLSNSYTPWVIENYTMAGFRVEEISARRMVAAKSSSRAAVSEAVILGF
jgi:DNA adenine methylase